MQLASGSRLGPYEILAPVGAGGMGEVYRARDTWLDRQVAIKVLPSALSQNSHLREHVGQTKSRFAGPPVSIQSLEVNLMDSF